MSTNITGSNTLKNTFTGNKRVQDIANNTLCLALERIKGEYTGDCLKLRRDSDDAELDFGFDSNGDIDTSAISTWGTTDTLYIVAWYDQSGWGNDANQLTKANQPVWDNINKKIVFTSANSNYLIVTDSPSINVDTNDFSYVANVNFTNLVSDSHVFNKGSFSSPRTYIRMYYFGGTLKFATEDISAPEESVVYVSVAATTDYNLIGIKEGDNLKAYKDGVLDNVTLLSPTYGSLTTISDLTIGSQVGIGYLDGSMTSFMLFRKALSARETALVSDTDYNELNPLDYSPSIWFDIPDSSSITRDINDKTSALNDKSGSSLNVSNPVEATQPLYVLNELNGKNVLRFDGVDDTLFRNNVLGATFLSANEATIFIVNKHDALNTSIPFMWGNQFRIYNPWVDGDVDFDSPTSGSRITLAGQGDKLDWAVWVGVKESKFLSSVYYNGNFLFNGGTSTSIGVASSIKLEVSNAGFPMLGDIAEIIVFPRALTSVEISRFNQHLKEKYALY